MEQTQRRFAVIVGVSSFEKDFAPLPFARNDATRLAKVLQVSGGFESSNVHILVDDPEEGGSAGSSAPTRRNVLGEIIPLAKSATEDDLLLFFFAGHGVEISGNPYLITCDTKMEIAKESAISVEHLNSIFEECRAKCVIRFFDACRSPFAEGRSVGYRMSQAFEDALMKTAKGWASFSSCSSGEVAHDDSEYQQGVFSYYLCEGLRGKAADEQGTISLEGLVAYVKTSVDNWCSRQSLSQAPHFQSSLSGTLQLATAVSLARPAATVVAHPLAELYGALEAHIAGASADVRNLKLSDKEEMNAFVSNVLDQSNSLAAEVSLPAVSLETFGRITESQFQVSRAWQPFNQDLGDYKVHKELIGPPSAVGLLFKSAELIVPTSELYLVAVRFSFFYWLWYFHGFRPDDRFKTFVPNPAYTKGFIPLKPAAARDGPKVGQAVREVLTRCTGPIVGWSSQLKEHLDSRMSPFRKMGPIVE